MIVPFICVNYNTSQETIKYIKNVKSISNSSTALIIIIDNSPDSDDFKILQKFVAENFNADSQVVLLKKENRGYFQGLNDGILYAKKLGYCDSYYVVGNNDIIFNDDFISQLENLKLNEDILVLAPDVITTEGSHENPHVVKRIGFLRKLKYDIYFSHFTIARLLSKIRSTERKYKNFDPIRKEIHMGIGALYVLTPKFFENFEKLSEEVFLYGEEAILAGQINSVKGKILYEPDLVCYHNESSTTSQMESKSKFKITQKSYKSYRKYL